MAKTLSYLHFVPASQCAYTKKRRPECQQQRRLGAFVLRGVYILSCGGYKEKKICQFTFYQ